MKRPVARATVSHVRTPNNPHADHPHPHHPSERSAQMPNAKWAAFLNAEMHQQFPEMFPKETKP